MHEGGTALIMNNRRFSPTRFVFILVLLGALYMVGKVVNPPPAAPPAPPAPPTAQATPTPSTQRLKPVSVAEQNKMREQRDKQMLVKQAEMTERSNIIKKLNGGQDLRQDDGTTSKYFTDHPMGKTGLSQDDRDEAHEKYVQAEADRIMKEREAHKTSGASDTPSASSNSGTPTPVNATVPPAAVNPRKP